MPYFLFSSNSCTKCIRHSIFYYIAYMLHIIHIITYQDFVRVFSAYGESDAIYGKFDGACVGHGLASPVVILHSHLERHQPRLLRAKPCQLIYTRALEIIPAAIKSAVVRVT